MPTLVAVDWDVREARVAAVALRGGRARLDHVFRVAWPGAATFDAEATAQRGAALKAALESRGLAKSDAVVTIGRAVVELKQLSLPPAPDAELPDMVRFLAQREFHSFGPEWLLDFLPTPAEAGEPRIVLAATVDPSSAAQVKQVVEAAGLRLKRLELRPCAAASLTLRRVGGDGEPRLLVDPGAEEVEVTALAGTNVVLLRSARMPTDPTSSDYRRALTAELKRTLASVHHQLAGRRVAAIELCGSAADWNAPAAQLSADLGVSVDVVDAWNPLPANLEAEAGIETSGRFAAVLGALADEAGQRAPQIDFLNPRRAPEPPNRRKQAIVGAFAATVVFALVWLVVQWRFAQLDEEIAELKKQSNALTPIVKSSQALEKRADEIDAWRRSDVVWLSELERTSKLAPSNQQVQLTMLRLSTSPQGGEVQLTGVVTEPSVVDELEQKLRDARHAVEGKGRRQDGALPKYPWRFQSNVVVKPAATATGTRPVAQGGR
ncbi:MAG: hypothetical protein JNL96_25750 [Planctomycetaceae bacterium]|nr:hypothetical protein [Planctomycetaceae bacterium]